MSEQPHGYSVERLVHYQCARCGGWWSIGDGPTDRELGCPWCAPPAHKRATMQKEATPCDASSRNNSPR